MQHLLDLLLVERCVAPSTEKAWRTSVAGLLKFAGAGITPQIACDRLSEFVAWRSKFGSAYTTSFYRRTLLCILRLGEEKGLCIVPRRVRAVKITAHEVLWFTDAEVRRLLCFATPLQRAAILLVRFGACRRGDCFRVRWSQLGEDNVLRWTMGKNGRRHQVFLPPEVIEACRAARAFGDDRLVPWPFTMGYWAKCWKQLGERSGVNVLDRGLQAIRRTAASLVGRDHGEIEACRLLGHSDGSGLAVFRKFYRVESLLDKPPPSPPPLTMGD